MATIKKAPKAQLGKLIKKGVNAATNPASKVSKLDYSDQKSRDFQREFLKIYPEKIKKLPNGNNKIDKVKKAKPEYDKNGLEILKDKNGGSVPKAKSGKSFPDLNKDGKVTRADILKGRGVIAQNGTAIKQQNWKKDYDSKVKGVKGMSENEKLKKGITRLAPVKKAMKMGGKMKTCKGGC